MASIAGHLCAMLAAGALAAFPASAAAQAYPAKPVRIVVPFGAGGVADVTARVVAQQLGERMGQQFVIENKPGAGGIVASQSVAKAAPDGYTLLLVSNLNAVSVSLFKSLPYKPASDFAMVSTLGFFPLGIVVQGKAGYRSTSELIAAMKANPGKFNIGTISIGSTQNLAAELFRSSTGVDATIIPYKDSPGVVLALKSGDIDVGFEILAPVMPHVRDGSLKLLAVTSDRRFPALPDLPTASESGVANYNVSSWNGIAAPAATPRPIIERLNKEVGAVIASPEVRQKLLDLGVIARAGTPEELDQLMAGEIAKWKGVIERAKIEKQ
jgi:tripartite-type tricarboxylate transporter receptor subunit TctC